MKSTTIILGLALLGLTVSACSTPGGNTTALESRAQQQSYAVGYQLSEQMLSQMTGIDTDAFLAGIRAQQSGEGALLDHDTMEQLVAEYQQEQGAEREAAARAQAEENRRRSEAFLSENANRPGVVTLDSGVQYEVLASGNGSRPPAPEHRVTVHYHGTLADGTVFDSSVERGEPATFPLSRVIPGFREALLQMSEGDKWRVAIPPELAYGERAPAHIGPHAALIFELELLEVHQDS
ncbi:FKBP-type peptidyl-prolyl cis-trans isomerase [Isoalcanivorax indicus]|uniref:FKBP-type peptidyl-prolyl cis-trans isomerase n=1 Tax=Isoalcanivorax indicus TaxID=2202653 RepID=UPI000DB99626|nr:FKBP-type peptidyl-prolyl cis-trans isomerase [Isoalcanivorax indicus]